MSIIKANGAGEVSTGFYGFEIENSLRFDDESSPVLTRASSNGNRDIFNFSAWVKRGDLSGSSQIIWESRIDNDNRIDIRFNSDNKIELFCEISNSTKVQKITSQVFRDTSSWYHLLFVGDTSEGTQADRIKLYVNGSEITSFSTNTNSLTSNQDLPVNVSTADIGVGANAIGTAEHDGYLADVNYIDGTALTPSSFGETKSGVWIPKDTSGLTFGTNGFRLEFKQTGTGTASSSTIGADTSGNDSHYTSTNLGAFDVMPDSPTNNFAVMNPLVGRGAGGGAYLDPRHGNLEMDTTNGGRGTTFSTLAMSPGTGEKYYAEYRYRADSGHMRVGVITVDDAADYRETSTFDDGTVSSSYVSVTGEIFVDGTEVYDNITYTTGNVIGIALDLENGSIEYFKDGTSIHSESNSIFSSNSFLFAAGDSSNSQDIRYSANFGQDSTFANDETAATNADTNGIGAFHTAVPSGFKALCTANLPEPPITPLNDDLPEDYFEANLWTGNGSSQSISSYEFAPDWVWIKERNSTSSHYVVDTVRGASLFMQTNSTVADTSNTVNVTSFDSNGFSLGDGGTTNENNKTYVGWAWLAGTAFSNDASATSVGTIDSSGQVNTKAGFSIISYTGAGSTETVAHGLSSAPEIVLHKNRTDAADWEFITTVIDGSVDFLRFTTADKGDSSRTASTSTVFEVGSGANQGASGKDYIAYCFHSVEGYSKMGAYTGNGNTEGQYIYTGFRPAFVLIKQSSSSGNNWNVHDNKRDVDNVVNARLLPSLDNNTETTFTALDFLSNGFKLRTTGTSYNGNGSKYIYMAFAEMPTKYANAR